MTIDGILDVYITSECVDGFRFERFIEHCILPHLLPYNGANPRSVVIMDNASIHSIQPVVDLINSSGALLIFLPPYSPDLMPIEECFSKVKAYIRSYDPIVSVFEDKEIEELILSAFSSVTKDDCEGWMRDCGYCMTC